MSSQSSFADDAIDKKTIASKIEHTLLADDIPEEKLRAHINDALALHVYGICIPLHTVPLAKKIIGPANLKVVTVIDFPLGQKRTNDKLLEAQSAKTFGADEIDIVLDYEALKNKDYEKPLNDISAVVKAVSPLVVKVIVETSALNKYQLACATTLVALSGAHFIKSSTGFHRAGAQAEDISLMRSLLKNTIGIKASGGIKTLQDAKKMVLAGATRIGTSSTKVILND